MKQITGASIILTEACNLNCSYCYEKLKSPLFMNIETAKKAIDFLLKNRNGGKNISVIWFGGEPLLNFPVLKEASEYIKEQVLIIDKEIKLDQLIITNGTLWNDEIKDFLEMNKNIRVQLSWDGMPLYQDKDRGSSSIFEKNLNEFLKLENKVYVHLQVTPFMAPNLLENIDYVASKMGNKMDVCLRPIPEINGWLDDGILENYQIQLFKVFEKYGERINIVKNCELAVRSKGTCGAGKSFASIAPDGKIYACHRFYFSKKRDYFLGDINNTFICNVKTELLEDYEKDNIIGCDNCPSYEICDRCIAANFSENNDIFLPSESHCKISVASFNTLLKYNTKYRPWLLNNSSNTFEAFPVDFPDLSAKDIIKLHIIPYINRLDSKINEQDIEIHNLNVKLDYYRKQR